MEADSEFPKTPAPAPVGPPLMPLRRPPHVAGWRREALRTNLWVVPTALLVVAALLFLVTLSIDRLAAAGALRLPAWVNSGSPDAGRQILTAIAAAIITVVGVVFSITIVALTLASTQFGPRMLRNFIRSFGTQFTLGVFVGTFLYSVLALVAIGQSFVPHLSITVDFVLVVVDMIVLIYFIQHVATTIQLNHVVADIARDFIGAIDAQTAADAAAAAPGRAVSYVGPSVEELTAWLDTHRGGEVVAVASGFLQLVDHERLISVASSAGAVIRLVHRPGHFVVEGRPLAHVWPPEAAPVVARTLGRGHYIGSARTLTQDMVLAMDQLVEIALRALSAAVNDTFTSLACIDWLAAGLCKVSAAPPPVRVFRDDRGHIRLIVAGLTYARIVNGAFDKVRQAGRGMPAVMIRQLEAISRIMEFAGEEDQRRVLLRQADMLLRASQESVPEENDRADIRTRYDLVLDTMRRVEAGAPPPLDESDARTASELGDPS